MALQLEHILAGIGMRRRKKDRQTGVDHLAVGGSKGQQRGLTRHKRPAADRLDQDPQVAARHPHHANRTPPGRGRNRSNRISAR